MLNALVSPAAAAVARTEFWNEEVCSQFVGLNDVDALVSASFRLPAIMEFLI